MENPVLDKILRNFDKTYELALQYGSDGTKDKKLYLEAAEELCLTELKTIQMHKAIRKASEANELDRFDIMFNAEISKQKNFNAKSTSRFKDFDEKIQRISDNFECSGSTETDDGEIRMTNTISLIDPITKQLLVNPVRNKLCMHAYGRDTIEELLKVNPRLRCPVVGCGNKSFIKMEDLIVDNELTQEVRRQIDLKDE